MNECYGFFYFEMAPERCFQKAGSGPDFSRPLACIPVLEYFGASVLCSCVPGGVPGATQRTCVIPLPKVEPGRILSLYQAQVGKD